MIFEKWMEEMSKEIFLPGDEDKKVLSTIFDMYDEDVEEEESQSSRSKKKWGTMV
ncbi:MAG: hypothetical protein AB1502_01095 [Thermodesulfobacteriota bacterium]